ncbi:MAG TPA: hypothetical protein VMH02_08490 [Verrucomicrobiae bacterium]|nr:hypothetical protein [Verrucomicrobiae bacterium]
MPTASPVPASPPPRRPVPLRAAASAPAILPPAAPPEIIALELRSRVVHPGERVVGRVVASSNVASVEVRIGGYSIAMEKTGVGRFALSYVVPDVPFLRGTFVMQVIARNSGGASVERSLPLEIR